MNADDAFRQLTAAIQESVLLERLFFASLEFAALALLVAVAASLFRRRSPRLVALLWLLVLVKPLASLALGSPLPVVKLPAATSAEHIVAGDPDSTRPARADNPFESPPQHAGDDAAHRHDHFETTIAPTAASNASFSSNAGDLGNAAAPAAPRAAAQGTLSAGGLAIAAWLVGAAVFAIAALAGHLRLRRLMNASLPASECLTRRLSTLARELGLRRAVRLCITDQLESPALAGVWRPVVLLPAWLVESGRKEAAALDWALRHELTHYKHGDTAANLACTASQILFFFHPAVWWAAARWRAAMELACDRALVGSPAEARDYAEGLYRLLSAMQNRRRLALAGSLFVTRTQIGRRIEALLETTCHAPRKLSPVVIAGLVLLSIVGLSVGAQFDDSPAPIAAASRDETDSADAPASESPAAIDDKDKSAASSDGDDDQRDATRREGVIVFHAGLDPQYAVAIARTVSAARRIAIEQFGFDMPETIVVDVRIDPAAPRRLFNDGHDRLSLSVRSMDDLKQPKTSGAFHLYGLCHETGHLAMYRPIRERSWMTMAAAEGFAHYLGSRLVDAVYAQEGADLWPDRYDYLQDGMLRLQQQLAGDELDEVHQGAALWKSLFDDFGDRAAARLFAAWGGAAFDPANPGAALRAALAETLEDPQATAWWDRAAEPFVFRVERSRFTAVNAPQESEASGGGKENELALDDGQEAGKKSFAGGGHAVRFTAKVDSPTVTSVRIFGSRYGSQQRPDDEFQVWLCDNEFKPIADFRFPYAKFQRGAPEWVTLPIKPTRVPQEFFVCCGFNPTASKGVYVSYDGAASGASFSGLPGREPGEFAEGDWLIRATIGASSTARVWKDSTGAFSVEAELVDAAGGQVRLKRTDGSIISVPLEKLSAADQQFIRERGDGNQSPANAPANVSAGSLAGQPQELHSDDGEPAGKKSLPQGFAAEFAVEEDDLYLTMIRVHGARYGAPRAPREDFQVALCDEKFQLIEKFELPYSKFERGDSEWVDLRIKPTKVPAKFIICLDFNATGTKGVYVSYDAEGRGLMGQPGKPAGDFSGGDWLIRAVVDRAKP